MRGRIVAGIGFVILAIILKFLILFGILDECAQRFDYLPLTHVCLLGPYIIAIAIAQIFIVVAGGALILLGLWSRTIKPAISE
jgi:hypothetical protein